MKKWGRPKIDEKIGWGETRTSLRGRPKKAQISTWVKPDIFKITKRLSHRIVPSRHVYRQKPRECVGAASKAKVIVNLHFLVCCSSPPAWSCPRWSQVSVHAEWQGSVWKATGPASSTPSPWRHPSCRRDLGRGIFFGSTQRRCVWACQCSVRLDIQDQPFGFHAHQGKFVLIFLVHPCLFQGLWACVCAVSSFDSDVTSFVCSVWILSRDRRCDSNHIDTMLSQLDLAHTSPASSSNFLRAVSELATPDLSLEARFQMSSSICARDQRRTICALFPWSHDSWSPPLCTSSCLLLHVQVVLVSCPPPSTDAPSSSHGSRGARDPIATELFVLSRSHLGPLLRIVPVRDMPLFVQITASPVHHQLPKKKASFQLTSNFLPFDFAFKLWRKGTFSPNSTVSCWHFFRSTLPSSPTWYVDKTSAACSTSHAITGCCPLTFNPNRSSKPRPSTRTCSPESRQLHLHLLRRETCIRTPLQPNFSRSHPACEVYPLPSPRRKEDTKRGRADTWNCAFSSYAALLSLNTPLRLVALGWQEVPERCTTAPMMHRSRIIDGDARRESAKMRNTGWGK